MGLKIKVNEDVKPNKVAPRGLSYVNKDKIPYTLKLWDTLAKVDKAFGEVPQGQQVAFASEIGSRGILKAIDDKSKVVSFDLKKLEGGRFEIVMTITNKPPKPHKQAKQVDKPTS